MQMRFLLSSIALVTFSFLANAQAADHVKIGVLTDMNGPYAAITGKGSVAAAELAIEDFGGKALGKPVELVVADHMQKADVGASIARKWYDNEGVDAIFDGAGSSVALAILEIAKSRSKIVAFLRSDFARRDRKAVWRNDFELGLGHACDGRDQHHVADEIRWEALLLSYSRRCRWPRVGGGRRQDHRGERWIRRRLREAPNQYCGLLVISFAGSGSQA
jgi:hypothetical protein